jgi:hypothetical protein
MTTLREAAQQALEALENSRVFVTTREKIKHPEGTEWYDERITALRAALAQEDEPKGGGNLPPPLQAEPVQEPVVVKDSWGLTLKAGWDDLPIGTRLYTAPPRREWQRLTNEEMYGLYRRAGLEAYYPRDGVVQGDYDRRIDAYARAIETKLKEKNHG